MKAVNNAVKYVPVFTLVLFAINLIVTIVDFRSADQFGSVVDGFGTLDIVSNFSHIDWGHFLGNMGTLLLFGAMTEILLSIRKKRIIYVGIVLAAIVGHLVLSEMFNVNGIGASGWLASFPVVSLPVTVWFTGTSKYWNGDYTHPAWALVLVQVMQIIVGLYWDLSKINSGDGIGHNAHLMGYGFGVLMFIIAAPFAVNAWVRTFARTRAQKRDIAARRLEFRRKMAAQQAAAMAA